MRNLVMLKMDAVAWRKGCLEGLVPGNFRYLTQLTVSLCDVMAVVISIRTRT